MARSADDVSAPYADLALARRLESLAAAEMRRFASTARALDPDGEAESANIAGGVATFVGADSPVNQAVGLGLARAVTHDDIALLEEFYLARGATPSLGVCPLAHPTLLEVLALRGWTADGFENVLVRTLAAHERFEDAHPGVEIREVATGDERDLWALIAATGFSDPLPPLPAQLALGRIVVRRPGSRLFVAYLDGKAAGTGEVLVEGGVAWLSGDTTLPQFRGRGVQQSLQRHRLGVGAALGCDLAVSESLPGSGSQRNMERAGFRVVYTRTDFVLHPSYHPSEGIAE